jgi:hypothetical protein
MFRLIAAIVMIMMPIISVSNGGSDGQSTSRDPLEWKACDQGDPSCGSPPDPFGVATVSSK